MDQFTSVCCKHKRQALTSKPEDPRPGYPSSFPSNLQTPSPATSPGITLFSLTVTQHSASKKYDCLFENIPYSLSP
ncbi:unnamed protein product [Protopolystoma xenopodis]|uniref:Uncharacterized protein n=1 Tax=Protopolystoma xenopodis TaxID=117903 RepID=A0A3S5CFR6_9PLAT|nr:unnamed protein product [Protopolystoma xenopodis]